MLDTYALVKNAHDLMTNYIRSRSVAVSQVTPTQPYIGSAVCIEIDTRLFIATAAHNFQDIPNGGTVNLFSNSTNSPLHVVGYNHGGYGAPNTLDLAWLEIDPISATENRLESVPMEVIEPYHIQKSPTAFYHVSGFPAQLAHPRTFNNHTDMVVPLLIYSTVSGKRDDSNVDNLSLDYGESGITANGIVTDMFHPRGISGAGIWYVPFIDPSQIWSPTKYLLVAIATQHFHLSGEIRGHIAGLRMHHWLKFLLADHPELSEHIEPLLNPPA